MDSLQWIDVMTRAPMAAGCLWLAWQLHISQQRLADSQEKRTADAQKVVQQVLALASEQNKVGSELAGSVRTMDERLRSIELRIKP